MEDRKGKRKVKSGDRKEEIAAKERKGRRERKVKVKQEKI
jgi:hypothetical protein